MISFHATCCTMTFDGALGAACFTDHMVNGHGAHLRKPGDGIRGCLLAAPWVFARAYVPKAPRPGTLPPGRDRLGMLDAARVCS